MGTLHEDVFTFVPISLRLLLRMRNVLNKIFRENENTHFVFNTFSENRAIYETMSKNLVEPQRRQKRWRLRMAYWMSKSTRAQAYVRFCAPTPTPPHKYTRTDARTHTQALTHSRVILLFHGNSGFGTRLKVVLYVHLFVFFSTLYVLYLLDIL